MDPSGPSVQSVDEWFDKWCLSQKEIKLRAKEAHQAIVEIEALIESYCDPQFQL